MRPRLYHFRGSDIGPSLLLLSGLLPPSFPSFSHQYLPGPPGSTDQDLKVPSATHPGGLLLAGTAARSPWASGRQGESRPCWFSLSSCAPSCFMVSPDSLLGEGCAGCPEAPGHPASLFSPYRQLGGNQPGTTRCGSGTHGQLGRPALQSQHQGQLHPLVPPPGGNGS